MLVYRPCSHSSTLVNVKWGKQVLSEVEVDTSQNGMTFKALLYSLTLVPIDKQKVMIKGKMLKASSPPLPRWPLTTPLLPFAH